MSIREREPNTCAGALWLDVEAVGPAIVMPTGPPPQIERRRIHGEMVDTSTVGGPLTPRIYTLCSCIHALRLWLLLGATSDRKHARDNSSEYDHGTVVARQ